MVRKILNDPWEFFKRSFSFYLALILIIFGAVSSIFPEWMHLYYREGFFNLARRVVDPIVSVIPFAVFWIFVIGIAISLIKSAFNNELSRLSWWMNAAGKWVAAFILWWGLNYSASDYRDLTHSYVQSSVPDVEAYSNFILGQAISIDSLTFRESFSFLSDEDALEEVSKLVGNHLEKKDLQAAGRPNLRYSDEGVLRKLGISGMYLPYTFECYVDPSLRPFSASFVVAHEMAHAYGYGNEAEASWIGVQSLLESKEESFRTAGKYLMVSAALNSLAYHHPGQEKIIKERLPSYMLHEMKAEHQSLMKYKTFWWKITEFTNNYYLKLSGQEDGVRTYDEFIIWMINSN